MLACGCAYVPRGGLIPCFDTVYDVGSGVGMEAILSRC